jgi:hypothetical protein
MPEQRHYSLSDQFDFGKHKGKTVDEVLSIDKRYFSWCHKNIEYFLIGDDVIDKYSGKLGDTTVKAANGQTMTFKEFLVYWNKTKIEKADKRYESTLERERRREAEQDYTAERRELEQLKRDAFSDGDGTELWSFENE